MTANRVRTVISSFIFHLESGVRWGNGESLDLVGRDVFVNV